MQISSRIPEGQPHRCPICGKVVALEPSKPVGDLICPKCAHLLAWFQERYGDDVKPSSSFLEVLGTDTDSLDIVEFVMDLEDDLGVSLQEEDAEEFVKIKTVADAITYIQRLRGDDFS